MSWIDAIGKILGSNKDKDKEVKVEDKAKQGVPEPTRQSSTPQDTTGGANSADVAKASLDLLEMQGQEAAAIGVREYLKRLQ
jgi:hypothetical protein